MKSERFEQFRVIREANAEMLTDRLNRAMYELRHKSPSVEVNGDQALIRYIEEETEPEGIADEYIAKGVRLTCADCPYFEPKRNADGTIDARSKWGDCPHAHLGRTSATSSMCEVIFEKLNNKEARICLVD